MCVATNKQTIVPKICFQEAFLYYFTHTMNSSIGRTAKILLVTLAIFLLCQNVWNVWRGRAVPWDNWTILLGMLVVVVNSYLTNERRPMLRKTLDIVGPGLLLISVFAGLLRDGFANS